MLSSGSSNNRSLGNRGRMKNFRLEVSSNGEPTRRDNQIVPATHKSLCYMCGLDPAGEPMARYFHGSELRGLNAVSRSPLFEGRFGRMFRDPPPLLPDLKDLEELPRHIVDPAPTGDADAAADNPPI